MEDKKEKKRRREKKKKRIKVRVYPYTYVRVCAMKSKLISKEEYLKLLKMKLNEIIRYLEDSEYKKEIDELAIEYKGVDLIERALNKNLVDTFDKLRRISIDEELRFVIETYLKRWDIHNIKTILRGIVSNSNDNYIKSLLIPAGVFSKEFLVDLLKLRNVEEILKKIKILELENFKELTEKFKETNNLLDIENEFDRFYYNELLKLARGLPRRKKEFKSFLQDEVDILNIKTILRLKRKNIEKKKILQHLIFTDSDLDKKFKKKMVEAKDMEELYNILRKTKYKNLIPKEIEESLIDIELNLDKYLIGKSVLSTHQTPLTMSAILNFMFTKDIEVKNIRNIVKAKQLGLEDDFIEKKLVV